MIKFILSIPLKVSNWVGLSCFARFLYYWFRYPCGYHLSGHNFVTDKKDELTLICEDCGYIFKWWR